MSQTIRLDELWQQLTTLGHVEGDRPAYEKDNVTETPWYVSALVGISAWIAAAFLVAFLGAAGILENEWVMLAVGILFCALALGIKFTLKDAVFPNQLAFALSLAGQVLVISSQMMRLDYLGGQYQISMIVATVIVLETVLFLLYPDGLHRLISLIAIIVALVVQLVDWELSTFIPVLTLLLGCLTLVLWRWHVESLISFVQPYFKPLSIGLPLAALGLCIVQLTPVDFAEGPWWITAIGFGILFLVLDGTILTDLNISLRSAPALFLLLISLVLLIPAYQTPGVIVAVFIFCIAFWRRQSLLMGIGIAGFALFITFYYYNLALTLDIKSYLLISSGLGLLGLRLLTRRLLGEIQQ